MFNISLPSFLRRSNPRSSTADINVQLPTVQIQSIETLPSRPARALKHLIKLNHASHALFYNDLRFHNHTPQILASAFALGATSEQLSDLYEQEAKGLEPWKEAPAEISLEDWKEFWGKKEYQRAFVDFFEDQLVRLGYDWKQVLTEFLYDDRGGAVGAAAAKRLINDLVSDFGQPLVHLGYAIEFDSKTLAVEALSFGCGAADTFGRYLDEEKYTQQSLDRAGLDGSDAEPTPIELLNRVAGDERFDKLFNTRDHEHIETLFEERESEVLQYWNAWNVHKSPKEQFKLSQRAAVALLVATHDPKKTAEYDFFFVHLLTTSHAIRILLGSKLFAGWHAVLLRQWWLFTLAVYISHLRPAIREENIWNVELNGRDWDWVSKTALASDWGSNAYVKALRAMKEAAITWGDDDGFYLRAAVKFAQDFDDTKL